MAVTTTYMNYYIHISDPAEYQAAIAAGDGTGFYTKCPRFAATTFGIPYPYPSGNLETIDKTITFMMPFVPGTEFLFSGPTGINVDDTVDQQTIPGQAGTPASIWPATNDGLFIWCGIILLKGGQQGGVTFTPLTKRRWATGFESPIETLSESRFFSRAASRTVDGWGFYICRPGSAVGFQIALNRFITPTDGWRSWERFYFRYRALPANNVYFWFARGTASAGSNQARIRLNTDGSLSFVNYASPTNTVLFSSTPLVQDQWYKIDVIVEFNPSGAGGNGRLRAFLNGESLGDATVTTGFGSNSTIFGHTESKLGVGNEFDIGLFASFEADFDDWINAEIPSGLASMDFLFGTHIIPSYVIAFGTANTGGWTPVTAGAYGLMNAWKTAQAPILAASCNISSTTGSAVLSGNTDYQLSEDMLPAIIFGVVSSLTCYRLIDADAANGTAGIHVDFTNTLVSVLDTGPGIIQAQATISEGLTTPLDGDPNGPMKVKSANANLTVLNGLVVFLELVGCFDYNDAVDALLPPVAPVLHNSFYPNTQYAVQGGPFSAPVQAVGGTYVGTGTEVNFTLDLPVHFLWVRNTSNHQSWHWFASTIGGHKSQQTNVYDGSPIRCFYQTSSGVTTVTIAGNDTQINASGTTYQYIAFCDPGMRYCSSVPAIQKGSAVTSTVDLFDPLWLPDAVMMQKERFTAQNASDLYYKYQSAGQNATPFDGVETTNIMSFTTGLINIGTATNASVDDTISFMAWRCDDGSGVMVQICSYTGNGASPRTINLTPVSGRFPLLAIVKPRGAGQVAIFRDPSHTGANSANYTGTNTTTGITGGGIDTITVQASLNTNLVVYDVFVITGDTNAWNNGEFGPPPGIGSGFPTPGPVSTEPNVIGDGGLLLGNTEAAMTLLKDISGIYTLIENKHEDTLMDRQTGQDEVDTKIPDPTFGTGFVGG